MAEALLDAWQTWADAPKHQLFGSVCICGDWSAQCGNDIPRQWAMHLAAADRTPQAAPTRDDKRGDRPWLSK